MTNTFNRHRLGLQSYKVNLLFNNSVSIQSKLPRKKRTALALLDKT